MTQGTTIVVPEHTYDALERLAQRQEKTFEQILVDALVDYVDRAVVKASASMTVSELVLAQLRIGEQTVKDIVAVIPHGESVTRAALSRLKTAGHVVARSTTGPTKLWRLRTD